MGAQFNKRHYICRIDGSILESGRVILQDIQELPSRQVNEWVHGKISVSNHVELCLVPNVLARELVTAHN